MATKALPTTLSGLFNLKPTPIPFSTGPTNISSTTPQVIPKTPVAAPAPSNATIASLLTSSLPQPKPAATPAPVVMNSVPVTPGPQGTPVTQTPSLFNPAPTGATGAAPASQTPINPQFVNTDGSLKSPSQVASEVASTLKAAHGTGDVGTLAGQQFAGGNQGTTANAQAQARQINNTRNDIAVGETDPYKVASQSGIAYTAAELNAIEKAYAGIYDPALDTALAKVTQKQNADASAASAKADEDKIRLQASLDANKPYTLGKDDVRYDGAGNPLAVGGNVGNGGATTYVAGQDPTADAYINGVKNNTFKISDIPEGYKGIVAQGLAQSTGANAPLSKTSTDAIGIINQLQQLDLDALSGTGVVGALFHPKTALGFPTDVQNTQNLAKQLQATLSLANRQQLKGQGAISDFEFKVLGDAAAALGIDGNGRTNLSADDFKKGLQNLELKLQVGPTNLTDDEIQFLASPAGGGFTPDQIRSYSQSQSFSSVGNTTASTGQNRPQRNNNPGNVKAGGLSDSLAVGKDDQGHLIFPNPDAGFKALTADLTAKINGGSKYLPKNPTIAQLGKVYAEDPNWPKKVAMMLGVGVDTPTSTVPIAKLVKAVATQEGFYA